MFVSKMSMFMYNLFESKKYKKKHSHFEVVVRLPGPILCKLIFL